MPPTSNSQSLISRSSVSLRHLPNGVTLAAYENPVSPAVVLTGLLRVGAMDEPQAEQGGLAGLTAALLSRGTVWQPYDEWNDAIEGVGASVGFGSGTHTTSASAKCLAEDFPAILRLTVEALRQPTFPQEHLARVQAQRVTALRERETNTGAVASRLFYEHAYPAPHPYHFDPSGTADTVAQLARDDLVHFHQEHYGPDGAIFLVVGAIPPGEALDQLETAFRDWEPLTTHRADRGVPDAVWPPEAVEVFGVVPGKTQSDLLLGLPAVARTHPDFRALQLANTVLGTFGMMGRIGKSVRDAQGLAYSVRSSLHATSGPGAWVASAGVAPDKVAQAVAAIRAEWVRMGEEAVPEAELDDSKALIIGSLPLRLETNEGIAGTLLDILYYDLGLDYLLDFAARIHAISPEDVRCVSARYFDPARAVLAVAGPMA